VLDSVTYESYPTHPLGARDRWPVTGPIYGIAERDSESPPAKTIWQRFASNLYDIPESMAAMPGNPPVWY
jgi:hypothetical protein